MLIPLRLPPLAVDRVPAPYPAVLNIIAHGDFEMLALALDKKGIARG